MKCEKCGKNLIINHTNQLSKCPFCGAEYTLAEMDQTMDAQKAEDECTQTMKHCNESISQNPNDHSPWLSKGAAHIKLEQLPEAMECFQKSLDLCPAEQQAQCRQAIADEICTILLALTGRYCDAFVQAPDETTAADICGFAKTQITDGLDFLQQNDISYPPDLLKSAAKKMYDAVHAAWRDKLQTEYIIPGFRKSVVTYKQCHRLVTRCQWCINILLAALDVNSEKSPLAILIYLELIQITKAMALCRCMDNEQDVNSYYFSMDQRREYANLIDSYHVKIHEIDPAYEVPGATEKGGCYVATAVYGSYDCPQVWRLRRFRDGYLAKNWVGRNFIRFYYAISPGLVKHLGNRTWFRRFARFWLERLLSRLSQRGLSDQPYQDKREML